MGIYVSPCGLNCLACPAFKATKDNDDDARRTVAADWSKLYKSDIKPEDINCKGCNSSEQPLFHYCQICEIRSCAQGLGFVTCAECNQYACDKLSAFFGFAPEAKNTLDRIRSEK